MPLNFLILYNKIEMKNGKITVAKTHILLKLLALFHCFYAKRNKRARRIMIDSQNAIDRSAEKLHNLDHLNQRATNYINKKLTLLAES